MAKNTHKSQPEGTYRIEITGLVQGVGFRPFIYRLASDLGMKGWVENRNSGVLLVTGGDEAEIENFRDKLLELAPAAASIESVEYTQVEDEKLGDFEIRTSSDLSDSITEISPDIAVCPECLSDMLSQEHRIGYPLINCTHCGPRFSIIRDLPYDRQHTTMETFEMCPQCQFEYRDIKDRRFHAQPVACNHCGPSYQLVSGGKAFDKVEDIRIQLLEILREGGVVAMKGTGGFHLVCSAFSKEGVKKLRELKKRDGKPFALMFRDTDQAKKYVEIGPAEETELTSWRRPIVLLRKKREITEGIADGLSSLGIMLPYMPFHHLLFEAGNVSALVMTSGNFSQEPILISNRKVKEQFGPKVDGVVSYNREIYNRVDDSVIVVIRGKPMVLRRARGFTPMPIRAHLDLEGILGTGAELTGSFCMGKGHLALMSQYAGDLKNLPNYEFYQEIYERYCRLFRFTPRLVVSDLHPDYLSTRFARELTQTFPELKHISVQHHHAHIASAMLDCGLDGDVLGFSFDGSGYGSDGRMWGAEVMRASYEDFDRLFHFEYVNLPGGDKASQEPWRMGLSYLYKCFGEELYALNVPLTGHFSRKDMGNILNLLDKKINCPPVSSAGRLFDAVAAILGLNYYSSYQAEAPMLLESAIDHSENGSYPYEREGEQLCFTSLIKGVVQDVHRGISVGRIAAKFHHTLVHLILEISMEYRARTGMERVVLAGGSFQNRFLCQQAMDRLEKEKFRVSVPGRIPPNDQGIAVGQLAIGAHRGKLL